MRKLYREEMSNFVYLEILKAKSLVSIFDKCIDDYHKIDDVNQEIIYPFEKKSFEGILYRKCWIDTVQWHYEDIIRDDEIKPKEALVLKRKIDKSNQKRTNLVEVIDDHFIDQFKNIIPKKNATINTESLAWAIDRLSILALKIYHMAEESSRISATRDHRMKCSEKLLILNEQKSDLCLAIDQLFNDISKGKKIMKVYRQMKMYNDEDLNPILYKKDKD
tara:strand:+ start:827 stop:1486 length:660 start_codon:yes stop_codon:yes gene_type:complete